MNDRPDIESVEKYYDEFLDRLIRDFLLGNERVEAALRFAFSRFPAGLNHILDLGCGLGWTSFEMARAFPAARVVGIDISDGLLRAGSLLFERPNLLFKKADIFTDAFAFDHLFDAVTLIDVYEHIPSESRTDFHRRLHKLLSPGARILVTCPTVQHQSWLRDHHPDQLQPVDEDVTAADMVRMAEDLEGTLTVFEYQSIWHSNDYFHALIERQPDWDARNATQGRRLPTLSGRLNRAALVTRKMEATQNPLREWSTLKRFVRRTILA